jgi:hypothetical protein
MENPFKNIKNIFDKKSKTKEEHKSEKDIATEKQLPYVNVVGFELDNPKKPDQGAFELDWNIYFVNQLLLWLTVRKLRFQRAKLQTLFLVRFFPQLESLYAICRNRCSSMIPSKAAKSRKVPDI